MRAIKVKWCVLRLLLGAGLLLSTALSAATFDILVDQDNNPATGCTVALPAAPFTFPGVEFIVTTTVNTAVFPPVVSGVSRRDCVTPPSTFGAPTVIDAGGWPVGIGTGTAGYDVLETYFTTAVPFGEYRFGFVYTDPAAGSSDVVVTTNGQVGGPTIIFGLGAFPVIPTLAHGTLLLLGFALAWFALRRLRRHKVSTLVIAGVLASIVAGTTWAAIVLDGLIADWAGVPVLASDPLGDAAGGADLSAIFAKLENPKIFVRADVKTASPPSFTSANATTFTVGTPGTFAITTFGIPAVTSITQSGALPAGVSFTDNGNGTASLNGTPGPGTGGTYALTFTASNGVPPSGTQNFTLTVNQPPAFTSGNATLCTVGVACSFTVAASGFPPPAISRGGVALPAGISYVDNSNGTGTLSGTPATGTVGLYALTFTAANVAGSTGAQPFTLSVQKANTTTVLTSSQNPSVLGQAVTFTATVSPQGTGLPTGSVSFTDNATPLCSNVPLNGSGVATCTLSSLALGVHTPVSAAYGGDGSFNGSNGSLPTQTVTLAASTTSIVSAPNPSVFGQTVTLSATVAATPPGSGTPTGTVQFNDNGNPLGGPVTLVAGAAALNTSTLSVGTHSNIAAVYSGDVNFGGSNATLVPAQVVNQAATSMSLTSAPNPSFFGQSVLFTATLAITAPGAGTPTGTVSFTDGITLLGTQTLVGGTTATLNTAGLAVGVHATLTATYNADTNFAGSTSSNYSHTVQASDTTTALTLSSGSNPSLFGAPLTFSATVSAVAPGAGTPSGTVSFFDNLSPLGNSTLAAGVAQLATAALSPGVHSITTTYAGDGNFNGSNGGPLGQTVNQAPDAVDDSGYTTVHDTPLIITAAGTPPGVLGNDSRGFPVAPITLVGATACPPFPCNSTTAQTGGNVAMNADGSFTYTPPPNYAGPDSFTYTLNNGVGPGDTATVSLTVTNVAPVVDLNGPDPALGIDFTAAFTEDGSAVAIVDAATLTVADADTVSGNLASATIIITNPLDQPNETLAVTCTVVSPGCQGAILAANVVYTPATGTLVITSNAPLADYQTLLRTLTYFNSSNTPNLTARDITVQINDGIANNSPLAHATVGVAATNDAPVLANIEPGALTYQVTAGPAAITSTLTVTDPDSANLQSATVQITANCSADDVLSLSPNPQNGITAAAYVPGPGPGTCLLSLSGSSSLLNYRDALRAVQFTNSNTATSTLLRTVTFQANDGAAASNTQTRDINVQVNIAPTITSANNATLTVGLLGPAFTITTSGIPPVTTITRGGVALPGGVTYVDNLNGTATLSGTPSAGTAGSYIFTFTATNGIAPDAVQNPFTLTINKQAQTISFTSTAPAAATVGGPSYTVTATATSALPVTFTIDPAATTVCSIAGATVSFLTVGTCVINANQAGDGTFSAAPQVQQSFAVGQGAQTINFTSSAPVAAAVGGPTYTVTATGGASGNPVTFTIDATASTVCSIVGATVSFIGAGTCVIDANQAGNVNYLAAPQAQQSFAVAKGAQTITFTSIAPTTAAVGGATYTVTATGGASGNPVTFTIDAVASAVCSIAGATVSFIGNGTCVIDANQAGDANYNAAPQVQQSFTVKTNQTISFTSSPPAQAAVGGATYTVTATATSGLAVSFTIDASASTVCSIVGATVSFIGNGTCVINANQAGNGSFYAAPQVQQSFTVKTAQTITFTSTAPNPALYQGPTYIVTATGGASGNPVTFTIDPSASTVCSIVGSTVSFIGTGICVINANQLGNANFYAAPQVQQSFAVAPNAVNDTFNALGNVLVDSSNGLNTPFAVADNDLFPAGTTISAFQNPSAQGGAVTMVQTAGATLGRFTYNPPVGFTGTDTFTYTLSSNGQTRTATVTFTVSGKVWFIDNNAGACSSNCNGRLTNPYVNTSNFQTDNTGAALKPSANDAIFVYGSGINYSGALTLLNGQRLVGQGAAGTLATLGNVTVGNGQALPATGGTSPVLTSAGVVLTVGSGNFVHGLTLGNGTTALAGTSFGTLTVNDNVVINTTGQGINLATGTLTATFISVTATGGTNSVNLTAVAGTSSLGSGALSGATGDALKIDGAAGSISYSGTITNAATLAVNILNKTGGAVTLSGDINPGGAAKGISASGNSGGTTITFSGANKKISTGTGAGVSLATNTGATINFSGGGLDITTTSGTGFNATGGGTVNVTTGANPNTINTGSGTGLNVTTTTIGASNLTFRSISSNGASSGIVLNTTGASGSLIVTGNGGSCTSAITCTGGAIQNSTTAGISLTSTTSPSFTRIAIQNAGQSGVDGQQVTNFTLANSFIDNVGTAAAGQYVESNIAFNDGGAFTTTSVSGTVSITNNILTNARRHGVQIENGSGTISNLTISNNTLTSSTNSTVSLGTAILALIQGSAATTSHVTTGTINGNLITNFPSAEGIAILGGSGNSSNNTSSTLGANGTPINITNNTIAGQAAAGQHMGSNAIRASMNSMVGVMNFNISCNGTTTGGCTATGPITNIEGQGISVFAGGTITGSTTINNNVLIPNQTLAAGTQGLAVQVDDGPAGLNTSAADYNVIITNNSVTNYEGSGIRAIVRVSLGKLDVTIQNNNVGTPILANRNGIRVDAGLSAPGDTTLCLNISGNTSDGSGVNQGIGIRKQGTVATVHDFGIVGLSPSPTTGANAAARIVTDNPAGGGVDVLSGDNFTSCTISP